MAAVICGSLAFDLIMNFEGRFADQILPDHIHILNASFLVPELRKEWGGCAGNIAYNLKALGGEPIPVASLGHDGASYLERLKNLGMSVDYVKVLEDTYTAQAMIMTDRDNNQIIAFHPGAMMRAHETRLDRLPFQAKIGIIAPDGKQAMLEHAEQLSQAGIPFIFDPGQGLPMFSKEELLHFIELADYAAVNDYEGHMLCERTGLNLGDIAKRLKGFVVTLGEQGAQVWEDAEATLVPGEQASVVVDPTGCGDAFRAALLYGLEQGWTLRASAALGNRLGAVKIASRGGQNHYWEIPA